MRMVMPLLQQAGRKKPIPQLPHLHVPLPAAARAARQLLPPQPDCSHLNNTGNYLDSPGDDCHCITIGKKTIGLLDGFFIAGKESFPSAQR